MLRIRNQSFRRYRVVGKAPSPYAPEFAEQLHAKRFRPLTKTEERTHGWVSAHNLLVTRFDVDTLIRGEHVAFALRVDRRRVPPRLLRAHLDLEIEAHRKALADARDERRVEEGAKPRRKSNRLSAEARKSLRDDVTTRLLKDAPLRVDSYGVLYDPRSGIVLAQTLARQPNEWIQMHFEATFEARLTPLTPWARANEILAGTDAQAHLQDIRRSDFTARGASMDELERAAAGGTRS